MILPILAMLAVDYKMILFHGQSLSVGTSTGSCLSTTQPYTNKTLSGTDPVRTGTSLTDLLCNASVEPPHIGAANQLTALATTLPVLAATHGQLASQYTSIKRTPTAPSMPITNTGPYINGQTQLANFRTAIGSDTSQLVAYCLKHGESDFQADTDAATYVGYMLQLRADMEFDRNRIWGTGVIDQPLPLFTDQIHTTRVLGNTVPKTSGGSDGTPLAQWQGARDYPSQIYLVGPNYQYTFAVDHLHTVAASSRHVGEMFAKAMYKVLILKQPWIPLAPRSITRSGATVTIRYWVPVGSLTLDTTTRVQRGACDATNNCYGFEWSDSTSSAYPTGVSVSGDTATITLNTTPSGTSQRIRYAYTGTGNIDTTTGSYGNLRDTDSATSIGGNSLADWAITFDEPIGFTWEPYPPTRKIRYSAMRGSVR